MKKSVNSFTCVIMFLLFSVLTLIGALNHELWFDEAQAWVIARDNDILGIFNQLKFEGHPPLWYLILHLLSLMGFDCTIISIFSWIVVVFAVAIIIWKAPFGNIVKISVIFSSGFLFYNTVISRVYCLILLLLCLIAWVYPKRKEHPIYFGILIALLANTHICMSGFVGIVGIYMIIELFISFKNLNFKQNMLNVLGIVISGTGVLILIFPLFNTLGSNSIVSEKSITLNIVILSIFESFTNISNSAISGYFDNVFLYLVACLISILMIFMLFLLRHYKKPLIMMLFFIIFYIVSSELLWYTIPNRATIFIFMFFIVFWIAKQDEDCDATKIECSDKISLSLLRKAINFISNLDFNFDKTYTVILCVILITTIPSGCIYLFRDYGEDFCPAKASAEYIKQNIPHDAVFVTASDSASQFSAYLPEYKFYAINQSEFYTYMYHKQPDENIDNSKIKKDLMNENNIYYLYFAIDPDISQYAADVIYMRRGNIHFDVNIGYVEISKFDFVDE